MDTQIASLGEHPFVAIGLLAVIVLGMTLAQYLDGFYDKREKLKKGIVEYDFSGSRLLQ